MKKFEPDEKFKKQIEEIENLIDAAGKEKNSQGYFVQALFMFAVGDDEGMNVHCHLGNIEKSAFSAIEAVEIISKALGLGFVHFCKDEHEHEKFFIEKKEGKEN